jgi:hypothetical protein
VLDAPGFRTDDNNFMTKPTIPMTPMPKKQIFIDNQSSLLPGFIASFSVLAA